ncbi:hypothetical protein BC939DRAFT_525991 [Gamsiella multidivaricata]|uniref:uncharacterized protein n=1 Tax=Gamsiella multidivaricata TaxID=101098 RepID=UPI00221EB276|nr:uncharacterized protein BC939DRAFT_525991 [Gamsiella multidivaricata]KAG0360676.1 hypothetical protein BGZ54_009441 [Gamsiella multidivaricata]KAI7829846.1 hypothetical protein BC939DRAFT_525991 [Gamsiella multidivaricata]
MKIFATIAALACLAVARSQTLPPITNCATGPTDLTIDTFTLAPYPLCINQNVCATGTGQLSVPLIQGAKLAITGRYGGRVVYTDNQDVCTLLASQGFSCPIPITMTSITVCVLVKPTAPANVPVALTVLVTNGNGNVLFCQAANGVIAKNC